MPKLHHVQGLAQDPEKLGTSERSLAVSRIVDSYATSRPRHACPIAGCPYKSTKPTDVQRHLESRKHGEGVQYKCTDVTDGVICGQVIQGRPDNLIRHVVTQHGWDEDQVRTRIGPIMRDARDRRAANARSGANDREVRWAP